MLQVQGIIPPVPTPFGAHEEPALEKLQENITRLSRFALAGFLILGSNGEKVMLSEKEQQQVLEAAREVIPAGKVMLAGTGEQSTQATIRMTLAATAVGADAALVLNPSYYKGQMTKAALLAHYRDVAEASPIPIFLYNMPACSGLDLAAEVIIELSAHPNIAGLKDSGGDIGKMAEVIRSSAPGFQVLVGAADVLLAALSVGASGGILALADIAPGLCLELYESYRAGKVEAARELQLRMLPISRAISTGGGIAALKAAMDELGLYGGPTRRPLQPVSAGERERLLAVIGDLPRL